MLDSAGERDSGRGGTRKSHNAQWIAPRPLPSATEAVKGETPTYDRALTLLGFRARSVAELRRKLIEKGAPRAEVEDVLTRLIDQKLLDDADFARQFARTKITGAGTSRIRILQELRRKGIANDVAERALQDLDDEEGLDPSASIRRVADKKWKTLGKLDDVTRRRRLYAFLARRGFGPDEIRSVMNALGAEMDA
jgi:regulatory protein